jgi:enamine deaminase RidA (YjgF/YER057c/UK114 family)
MAAPIRRRLSQGVSGRGAPGVVAEDQAFVAHQVPLDAKDPVQAAWNERQWREVGGNLQTVYARLGAVEQALLDLEERTKDTFIELEGRLDALEVIVAADTWDRAP